MTTIKMKDSPGSLGTFPLDIYEGKGSKPFRRVRVVKTLREGQGGRKVFVSDEGERFIARTSGLGAVPYPEESSS